MVPKTLDVNDAGSIRLSRMRPTNHGTCPQATPVLPKGPCTQTVYTLALSSPYIGTIWAQSNYTT